MSKALSDKQFIRKASAVKVIAGAFLDAYENHIRTSYKGAHIALDQYRSGEMLPNVALEFVKNVVHEHILQNDIARAEESIKKQQVKRPPPKTNVCGTGKYECVFIVKLVNERTLESEEIVFVDHNGYDTWKCNDFQSALRLVDRKQSEMANSVYATISQELAPGRKLTTQVSRTDSTARHWKESKGPVVKGKPTSAPLKNFMSCKNDTCSFSHG